MLINNSIIIIKVAASLDEDTLGGIELCIERMMNADPNFCQLSITHVFYLFTTSVWRSDLFSVMGRCLSLGLQLLSTAKCARLSTEIANDVNRLSRDLTGDIALTRREELHGKAVIALANGFFLLTFSFYSFYIPAICGML